ncbi:MAG: hypothetical protein HOP10_08330 [Chitinophagaceae bacterium]|nr:hypothetical protein [Chitinophagaceae bacterium]
MREYLFAIFCFLSPLFVLAEDQFVVYSLQGEITLETNKHENRIKKGDIVASTALVKIPAEGFITFICKKGGWFSITEPGNYSLNKFSDSCYNVKNSILTNFTKFMWSQVTNPLEDKGRNRKAYFDNVPGAVFRDQFNIWINPMFDTVNYSGAAGDFPLSWKCYIENSRFQFSLYNSNNTENPFYHIIIDKLKMPIADIVPRIKQSNTYYWAVALLNEEDDDLKVFNYVSPKTYDDVLGAIEKLKPAFEAKTEEIYRTAFMLENARYFAEAHHYYNQATVLDPSNVLYKATLTAFKKDYDIK